MEGKTVLQSFSDYDYEFHISGDGQAKRKIILLSKKSIPKNILVLSNDEFDSLNTQKVFKALLLKGDIRTLEEIPDSFVDATTRIAEARMREQGAISRAEKSEASFVEANAKIEALEKEIEGMGGHRN